tara:strand:+ start:937 stop:2778 length:1842 start_codon:yes stop_codon:yes gene_type:complete
MADKKLSLDLEINKGGSEKSVKSIKQELKEAREEAMKLTREFGEFSPEAQNAAKKLAGLRDEMGDLNDAVQGLNPDKFARMATLTNGLVRGFQVAQGAMAMFGVAGEDMEKTIAKLQATMAMADGIQGVLDARKSFAALGRDLVGPVVAAFKKFSTAARAAIVSTGIGALVVSLGLVIAYFDDIKEAISGISEEQKKLNKETNKNLETEQKKLETIGDQDNILKLQGKTEQEILDIKINQTDEVIKAQELAIQNAEFTLKAQIEAETRNQNILKGLLNFVSLPITAVLRGIDLIGQAMGKELKLWEQFSTFTSSLVFDPIKVKEDGQATIDASKVTLNALKNQKAGYQLTVKEDNAKEKVEREKTAEEIRQENLKDLLETTGILTKRAEIKSDAAIKQVDIDLGVKETLKTNQAEFDKNAQEQVKKNGEAILKINTEKNAKDIENEKIYRQSLHDLASSSAISLLQSLDTINQAFTGNTEAAQKKAFERSKIFQMAETLINTYAAAQKAYVNTVPGPFFTARAAIGAGTAIVSGLSRVAAINKTQYGSKTGTNPSNPSNTSTPAIATGFSYIGKPQAQEPAKQLPPQKVYIVSHEMKSALSTDENILSKAVVK